MKATDTFKNTIKKYLDERAETDTLFAEKYSNPEKNLDDCITYILNTVKATGKNGFADEEIYNMAIHYYDEDNVEVGQRISASRVVVNHVVELTDEEKEQARKDAIKKYQEDSIAAMKKRQSRPRKASNEEVEQPTLFDA